MRFRQRSLDSVKREVIVNRALAYSTAIYGVLVQGKNSAGCQGYRSKQCRALSSGRSNAEIDNKHGSTQIIRSFQTVIRKCSQAR